MTVDGKEYYTTQDFADMFGYSSRNVFGHSFGFMKKAGREFPTCDMTVNGSRKERLWSTSRLEEILNHMSWWLSRSTTTSHMLPK